MVLRLLRGESLEMVSREVGVELYRLEAWQARALAGLELGLKAQGGEPLAAELVPHQKLGPRRRPSTERQTTSALVSWHEHIRSLFPRRGRPAWAELCTHLCEEPHGGGCLHHHHLAEQVAIGAELVKGGGSLREFLQPVVVWCLGYLIF